MSQQLEEQIFLLESRRVTDRKKACEYLFGNINDPEIIQQLNNGGWNRLLTGVQHCLLKDADKLFDDMKKKGTDLCSCYISSDLYLAVLRYGLQEKDVLNIQDITEHIISCLRNVKMKKCFEVSLLTALKDFVLLPESNRSELDVDHWENLFDLLKSFYAKANVTSDLKKHYIKCLMLLFKFAPSCGYSPQSYRDEVVFINNLVENVKKSHHKVIQQDIVEIVTDFCFNIAKDRRITCCELGDCTFLNLFELYECNGREEELKLNGTNDLNMSLSMTTVSQMPAQKKAKIDEISVISIIHNIKTNREWPWINLLSFTLKKYPSLIDLDGIDNFLNILSSIIIESQEINLKYHAYQCLIILEEIENKINVGNKKTVLKQWKEISKYALLSMNNIDNTQILVRRLVLRKNIVDAEKLLQNFLISKYTSENGLKTLFALLPQISFPRSDTTKQESIINWLFNLYSTKFLCCKESVFIFGCLLFKQWPHEIYLEDSIEENSNCDITDVYYKINLNMDDTKEITDEKHCVENRVIDKEALYKLMIILQKNCAPKDVESTLHVTEFLVNLIDFILDNKIREDCPTLVELLQTNMEKLEDFFSLANKNALLKNMVSHMNILYRIFSPKKNTDVSLLIRKLVSESLLKVIFDWNHFIQEEKSNGNASPQLFKIKESLMKTLSLYSFVSSQDEILENQTFVLDALCDCDNIDFVDEDGCKIVNFHLVLVVLKHLKYATPGLLTNAIAKNIVDHIQKLCEKKYRIYDYVVSVLDVLKYFYPHMAHLNREIQEKGIGIMSTFNDNKDKYGPKVSYAILDCIESLYKVDPAASFTKVEGQELIALVPDFLSNEHIEVRLKAIETLVLFFVVTSKNKNISDIHRQEIVIHTIYEVVRDSEKEVQKSGSPDDIANINATVLLMFARLMLSCTFWIEEYLLCLMKLIQVVNLQSVDKILTTVSLKLTNSKSQNNFLESNLPNLIEKWINQGNKLGQFPYKLLNCLNEIQFYKKYIHICVPFLIKDDAQGLKQAADELNTSQENLIIQAIPKIFTKLIYEEIENLSTEKVTKNIYMLRLSNYMSQNKIMDILKNNLDEIILNLLLFVTDSKKISEKFGESVLFYNKYMSYEQFLDCLRFLKEFLDLYDDLLPHLLLKQSKKIERILLGLKSNIYNTITLQDKIKHFHHYTIVLSLILKCINEKSNFSVYFIRDTSHYLINLMKSRGCERFRKVVTVFSLQYFKDIIPKYGDIFQQFFIFVVNSLKNIIITNESLKMDCLEIVNFLIVKNITYLSDAISKLDTFPRTEEFEKFNTIIKNLKYNNKNVTLQEEIDFFLNSNDDECNSSQVDSLKQLRTILIKEKVQLKNMYKELKNIRGFSEDCIESHLHRLIAKLVKMTWGNDKSVSSEAVKCLGELGPANLLTLILQPEQSLENDKFWAFEMISGIAVLLLSKYIVDCDIRIARVASNALHDVLNSKEAMAMTNASFSFSKKGSIDKRFLVPYIGSEKLTQNTTVALNYERCISSMNSDELWCPKNNITHELWVVELVRALLEAFRDDCFLPKLIPICDEKIEICEDLLPHLIFQCLHDNKIAKILSTKINHFFEKQWLCSLNKSSSEDVIRDKRTVKCMLNVVDFVRLKKSYAKYHKANKLDVSYLYVAQASQYCDDHFAALLYAELYCYSKLEEVEKKHYKPLPSGYTKHDLIYDSLDTETAKAMHNIFRKAYKAIGDLDAMNGCGISFILEPEFRVESYKDSNQWDQVAHFYEMQVGRGDISCKKRLMDSLKMCSLYEVPLLCASGIEEQQYECLWRLGHWNFEEPTSNAEVKLDVNDFEKFKFRYLKSLHDDDKFNFEKSTHLQNLCLVEKLKQTNLECSKNLYPILTEVQSLVEALDFAEAFDSGDFEGLLQKWRLQDLISEDSEFRYIEPIIAQRVVLLKSYLEIAKNKGLKEILVDMMLKFADLAREESEHRVASRILTDLQQMSKVNDIQKAKIDLSQAQLCWALNDKLAAKHILRKLGRNEEENPIIRSRALKLSGQYMVETYSENRQTIIADYFLKSLDIIDKTDTESTRQESDNIVDTYDKLASFADREYQQIVLHMKSDIFQKKISNMEKSKETARLIRSKKNQTEDERRAAVIHEKQSKIDEDEIENNKKERDNFLKLALRYYLKNLQRSDKNNIRIFRVMSLFLENRANASIKKIIVECMNKVPSYKYIDMLPQLVPHISEVNLDLFATEIFNIVKKCALEHPHHTLPLLLSLSNANEDRRFTKSKTNTFSNDDRVSSANSLLRKVKDTMDSDLVDRMDKVAKALIELAYYEAKNTNARKIDFSIPSSLKVTRIRASFSNVGGINAPKRIKCRGTDGIERSQLVKGRDDLRQDSVMEQVFTIMNSLLASNKQTTCLRIRTYKIMPLSMRSGILEWVDNSMPIGNYLVGGPGLEGAHSRYKSKEELSPTECRNQYKNGVGESQEVRLAIFNTICKRSKPVFHKFFEEHFLQPTVWYERRRAYIHSIATTSMCGYILGIGDRHVSNILVDKNTAEVIHIDFGIAFEQGRCLPTPETIPFRLTRDIVDGMGISGVEGIFKRSCEKTMEVLRTNAQTILTILEVLLYDPLYSWSVTPAEANKRQTDDLDEHSDTDDSYEESGKELNITAERALLRLRSKLQGTEEGNQASIEHQVGTLIQKAMDPSNLCRLFYGWQPYL
ncbi:unnamed protein product [Brassicogethes aeneus]|uniref:non-specific serine/threonine protein kinase n=1 Tax=Brassicogethes aeneus TaxID=1431903 RepID=A0A9P0BJM0_BRAAE|nr:unnamed protein product [Brassicogethes aeneus]